MTPTWWLVHAVGLLCAVGGFVLPLLRADRARRLTAARAYEGGGPWAIAVTVTGWCLLLTVSGMATEGLLPAVAVPGSAVAVSVVACALVVRRHDARLDRTSGTGSDR
ncbi:hypothetical protein KUM42_19770 [Modestobacter sp. L9-4]|uniref:hypothetical protein n=1 Tax=Modestobacter sp. L9-4 TaxID=2851567 RepID=UPI001C795A4A|nr:hypothetical protein [Modestobacter sp. L9-4]QXG75972.1 hypothetical protein KUM42_19770 [Modestobacter sp. L9-4]